MCIRYFKQITLLGILLVFLSLMTAFAANIVIVNADGAGEGFNDPTIATPIGGNTGTTLGAQRLEVFRNAAQSWGAYLESEVVIEVEAQFDPLSCNSSSAVLGSAGATTVHRNFINAPLSDTWYPQALANALAGSDLHPTVPDLGATFNSSIDNNNTCLLGTSWYLGLDGDNGGDIDLAEVGIHEIGHGLGFASYVDELTGKRFFSMIDIYSANLEDHSESLTWDLMTDAQRHTSAIDTGDLHFIGGNVDAAVGHAPMYAPNSVEQGSSVSHWSTSFTPNQLMEPFITNPPIHDPGLAYELMLDIGWLADIGNNLPAVNISSPINGDTFVAGSAVNLNGSASDIEDGNLDDSINWSSNLDGSLGAGNSLVVVFNTVGEHTISANVSDADSGSATAEVLIEITPAASVIPNPPTDVTAIMGETWPQVSWTTNSNEASFSIWRDSPHKKRAGMFVGGTEIGTVEAVTSFNDITGDAGTFRYCVRAHNSAGSSDWICSTTTVVVASDSTGGGGNTGGGGGNFCDAHPNHKRC